jgi:hypothetical protein
MSIEILFFHLPTVEMRDIEENSCEQISRLVRKKARLAVFIYVERIKQTRKSNLTNEQSSGTLVSNVVR